jgi:hypothetical protein
MLTLIIWLHWSSIGEITFERLLATKREKEGEFVFYEDGKIIKIKAKDYIRKRKINKFTKPFLMLCLL